MPLNIKHITKTKSALFTFLVFHKKELHPKQIPVIFFTCNTMISMGTKFVKHFSAVILMLVLYIYHWLKFCDPININTQGLKFGMAEISHLLINECSRTVCERGPQVV